MMMIGIPLLIYSPGDYGPSYGLGFVHQICMNQSISNESKYAVVDQYVRFMNQGPMAAPASILIKLIVSPLYDRDKVFNQYRLDNKREGSNFKLSYDYNDTVSSVYYETEGVFDDRQILYILSQYSIYLTLCVGFLLLLGYILFTADVQRLVLTPIERMMNMVEIVAQDPLQPLQVDKVHTSEQNAQSGYDHVSHMTYLVKTLRLGYQGAPNSVTGGELARFTAAPGIFVVFMPYLRGCDTNAGHSYFEESSS